MLTQIWVTTQFIKRLVARLGLRDAPKDNDSYPLIPSIQPITSMDDVLKTLSAYSPGTISCPSDAFYTIMTVPPGKRRRLISVGADQASGTVLIGPFVAVDPTGSYAFNVYTPTPATTVYSSGNLNYPLDAGWILKVYVDVTGASTITAVVYYEEEDAY